MIVILFILLICVEEYPSKLLANAIEQFASLPGVGKRTAMRFALHLLKLEKEEVNRFGEAFKNLRSEIIYCRYCYNISDTEVCDICKSPRRDASTICVVEDIRNVMAIENTAQYRGLYHVLGGIISPLDGIGPSDLRIEELLQRAKNEETKEVILALSTTMEGETTCFYLFKRLKDLPVKVTIIAQGVSSGNELEYADDLTLGRSLINRIPYHTLLAK
jgi:recombination protein RecR